MELKLRSLFTHVLRLALYGSLGVLLSGVVVAVVYLNSRADLSVWHLAELDEEFTVDSDVSSFEEYLSLEDRLFKQLDEEVTAKLTDDEKVQINRFYTGSLSDPKRWSRNWNRSFEMPVDRPGAGVLLLHGMSDSPYSLRNLAERLHKAGAYVVGLRIPGHGTAPSGLTRVTWQDMAAAVKIAVRHVTEKTQGQPLYIVGYSNGGALAMNYVLAALDDPGLPQITSLALLSPEIGISKVAALAVWQARLGILLGLDKLAWHSLLPEYDPYKYGSFAVNAGNVAYRLTNEIQQRLTVLTASGKINKIPPILAFSSIVDATVSAPALIEGLFDRIPEGGHELVLFNINRVADVQSMLKWDPSTMYWALQKNPGKTFVLSLVTNKSDSSQEVILASTPLHQAITVDTDIGLSWPHGLYSLTHVSLPFPPDDPLYGGLKNAKSPGIHLGDIVLRGERGVLKIPPAELLRLRWNPFYSFLEQKVLEWFKLEAQPTHPCSGPGHRCPVFNPKG